VTLLTYKSSSSLALFHSQSINKSMNQNMKYKAFFQEESTKEERRLTFRETAGAQLPQLLTRIAA